MRKTAPLYSELEPRNSQQFHEHHLLDRGDGAGFEAAKVDAGGRIGRVQDDRVHAGFKGMGTFRLGGNDLRAASSQSQLEKSATT